ncbi:MAG: LytR C-terminal domain-containing protein [bacterium]|nr:LytR C-terminal domain-containing protein [bacterium]
MILGNSKALLYLSNSGFHIYDEEGVSSVQFNFPTKLFEDSKLASKDALRDEVSNFVGAEAKNDKNGRELIIVLADDQVSADVLDSVQDGFKENGWESVIRSLPLAAQEIEVSKGLTPELVRAILTGSNMAAREEQEEKDAPTVVEVEEETEIEEVDPPSHEATEGEEEPDSGDLGTRPQPEGSLLDQVAAEAAGDGGGNMKKILIVVVLVLIGLGLIFAGLKFGGKLLGRSDDIEEEVATEEVTEAPTPTPTEAVIDKAEVSVEVLNGTGTAGHAGKAKSVFEDLGFEDITAGNAVSKDATSTTVEFSSDIPASVRKEVVDALDLVFDEVEQSENTTEKLMITVTTGPGQEAAATGTEE